MNPLPLSEDNRLKMENLRFAPVVLFLALSVFSLSGCGGKGTGPSSSRPVVTTLVAAPITPDGGQLNGTVNPNGLSTFAWFEWGDDPNLTNPNNTGRQDVGSGTAVEQVFASLAGLNVNSRVYFRVVASNPAGESRGAIASFDTSPVGPTVTTLGATGILDDGATLNGTVNPNGQSTEAWFEWGTVPSLTSFSETAHQAIGSGTANQPVSSTLTTLAPWSTYYFRAVASSAADVQKGDIRAFPTGEYYVAVGDSITAGYNDDIASDNTSLDGRNTGGGYEPILNNLLTAATGYPHTVVNEGVNDATSADGAAWISATLSNHPSAKYYLVMYGTNDASFPAVPSGLGLAPGQAGYSGSYKEHMQTILSAILAAGKTPYLAKVPYTSDPGIDTSRIQDYNRVIDELIIDNPILVTPPDFYSYFLAHPEELVGGLHPNGVGYQSMADLWSAALTTP